MSSYNQKNFRTFELPPGYLEKVEFYEEQLFVEDLNNNDKELWLFQASQEFDFSALKNKKVSMHGESIFQNEDCLMSGKSHQMSIFSRSDSELPDYQLLLPSRSNVGLFLAPRPFAGQVNLTEYVNKPSPVFQSFSPEKEKEDSSVLRQRYSPFGSGEPLITPKHKPLVKSNTSNADKNIERPASAKKKVTFKMSLTETQKQNKLEKAESSNQEISVLPEAAILKIASKQNKSNKMDTFQENESPNKAKSKKKKHSPFPKDSECRSRPFEEVIVPDVMLQYEETENPTEHKRDLHSVGAKNLNVVSNNNELPFIVGQQDDSTVPRKSKKKRKVDKSLRNDNEEDEITTKNAVLSYDPHSDVKYEKHLQENYLVGTNENSRHCLLLQVPDHSALTDQEVSHTMLQSYRRENPTDSKDDSHFIVAQNLNKASNTGEVEYSNGLQETSITQKKSKKKNKADKSLVNYTEKNFIAEGKVVSPNTSIKHPENNQDLYSHITRYPNLCNQKPLLENDDPHWAIMPKNSKKKKKKSKEHADLGGESMKDFTPKAKSLTPKAHSSGSQDSKHSFMVDNKLEASAIVDNTSSCNNEQSFPFAQQSCKKTKRKKESSESDCSKYDKKSKKRKLSDCFQESKKEILNTVLNIKQEVFSDSDDKSFNKQKLSDSICMKTKMKNEIKLDPETKVKTEIKPYPDSGHKQKLSDSICMKTKMKNEIKLDPETKVKTEIKPYPDSGHLTMSNLAERKKSGNAKDHKNEFSDSKKYNKSKKHEKE